MDASCQLSWSLRCDGDRLFIVMPGRNNVAMCSCSLALRSQLRVVYDRQLKVGKSSALCRSSKTIKPLNTDLQDPIKTQTSRSLRFLSPFTRGSTKGTAVFSGGFSMEKFGTSFFVPTFTHARPFIVTQ